MDFPWWIPFLVVLGGIVVYVLFMIFLPEWVGITGQTALKNEQSHREELPAPGTTSEAVDDTSKPPL